MSASPRRVLIVDDESLARARIRRFLEKDAASYEIEEAKDGFEAIELAARFKPQVIFLDVEMPELSGFDVLRNLRGHLAIHPAQVIFQTAYDQFALKAFEVAACDYLLKPFTDERLAQSIARAGRAAPPSVPVQALETELVKHGRYLERFVVRVGARSRVIEQKDVLFFLSESHVTRIMLAGVDYAFDQSLTDLESQLDPRVFLRVHRNAIVRIDQVASFRGLPTPSLTLKSGQSIKVSRASLKALKAALGR